MSQISPKRLSRMNDKEYRHEFMQDMLKGWISHQIRSIREQQELTQEALGKSCGKPQASIGRLESPNYGRWTLSTLLELADAFDVALQVRFVSWETFLHWTTDTTDESMRVDKWSLSEFVEPIEKTIVPSPAEQSEQSERSYQGPSLDRSYVWLIDEDISSQNQGLTSAAEWHSEWHSRLTDMGRYYGISSDRRDPACGVVHNSTAAGAASSTNRNRNDSKRISFCGSERKFGGRENQRSSAISW